MPRAPVRTYIGIEEADSDPRSWSIPVAWTGVPGCEGPDDGSKEIAERGRDLRERDGEMFGPPLPTPAHPCDME